MVAATMKISEYVVVIYSFQTEIANRSIFVKQHCFKEFIIYNFDFKNRDNDYRLL